MHTYELLNERLLLVKRYDFVEKERFLHFAVESPLHAPCNRGSTEHGTYMQQKALNLSNHRFIILYKHDLI